MADLKIRQAFQMALNQEEILLAGFGDPKFFALAPSTSPRARPSRRTRARTSTTRATQPEPRSCWPMRSTMGRPVPDPQLQAVRFPSPHGAGHGRAAESRWLRRDAGRGRLGDTGPAARRPCIVGHLHHAFGVLPGADAVAATARRWRYPAGGRHLPKDAALAAFNGEPDPAKRGPLWAKVQQVIYDEVPYIRAGNFGALAGVSSKMKNYTAMPFPAFDSTRRSRTPETASPCGSSSSMRPQPTRRSCPRRYGNLIVDHLLHLAPRRAPLCGVGLAVEGCERSIWQASSTSRETPIAELWPRQHRSREERRIR